MEYYLTFKTEPLGQHNGQHRTFPQSQKVLSHSTGLDATLYTAWHSDGKKASWGTGIYMWYIQFSSVTQLCPTLCDPMNGSTPGLPVYHQLQEFTQTHVYWVGDAIQPSHSLLSPSPPALNLSQHQGLFWWVSSLHQVAKVLRVSASTSVLPMNTQDWFPLGLTGFISLQSNGLSRVFSNTTVQKHQFFGTQLSSQSNSHIHTWLLEKCDT